MDKQPALSNYTSIPASVKTPFGNIALAFSGGGFRAAAYSLGVLAYLERLKLRDGSSMLQHVKYISSASGGTITAEMYALHQAQGKTFGSFYDFLYNRLKGEDLLNSALEILNDDSAWEHTNKTRNLINAFALSYDDKLFNGAVLGDLLNPAGHLEEVCFNATEFYHGLPFRQNILLRPDARPALEKDFYFGNYILHLEGKFPEQLKLSDLLAASSCFTVGFEPLQYPEDFMHGNLSREDMMKHLVANPATEDPANVAKLQINGFGLMDGGVDDNQGLESLMMADLRRQENIAEKQFDLMLVNDVGSQYMDSYVSPKFTRNGFLDKLSYNSFKVIFWALFLLTLVLVWLGADVENTVLSGTLFVMAGLLLAVEIIVLAVAQFIKGKIYKTGTKKSSFNLSDNFSPEIIDSLTTYFSRTPVYIIKQMLEARLFSVITLDNDVFLKRIRSLIYNRFYNTPAWNGRGKGNHVYDLAFVNDKNRANHADASTPPLNSKALQQVAQTSWEMPTTLWFDASREKTESLKSLVACGEFTTCYNLLEYTNRLLRDKTFEASPDYISVLTGVEAQLQKDWQKFQAQPFWMFNMYEKKPDKSQGG